MQALQLEQHGKMSPRILPVLFAEQVRISSHLRRKYNGPVQTVWAHFCSKVKELILTNFEKYSIIIMLF